MHRPWPQPGGRPFQKPVFYLLDQFSLADIKARQELKDRLLKFHWDFYSNLAYQRFQIKDELKASLLEACEKSFTFTRWQRTIRFKHSTEPLSIAGSLLDPGGRFNIGDINPSQFPPFPALYLASDRQTTIQEIFGQDVTKETLGHKIAALELALTKPDSITHVSVSGRLGSVINLNTPDKLQSFVNLIKNFTIPDGLFKEAKKMGFKESQMPTLVKNVPKLVEALLAKNWREWPVQLDVPVASQIFGQLVMSAGIEGIVYPSRFTNKDCIVIFPQNFDDTNGSIVQLDDPAPKETKVLKWDFETWRQLGST